MTIRTSVLVLVVGMGGGHLFGTAAAVADESQIVARSSVGSVTASELDEWLVARGEEPGGVRVDDVERLLLVRSMGEAAVERGLDREPQVRFELERVRDIELARRYYQARAAALVIEPADVEAALEQQPTVFTRPEKLRLRNITVSTDPAGGPEARAAARSRLETLRSRALAGEAFDDLARAYSDSQNRFSGGLIGNVARADLPPGLAVLVEGLEEGGISPVSETELGWVIVHLDRVIPARNPSTEERRRLMEDRLRTERRREVAEHERASMLEEAELVVVPDLASDAAPETVVATFRGGDMTLGRLRWLQAGRPSASSPENTRRVVEAWVVQMTASARAVAMGLDDATAEAAIEWGRRSVLATHEVARRIQVRFPPLSDKEVEQYVRDHPKRYRSPAMYELSVIHLTSAADGRDPEPARVGWEIVGRLRSGESTFAVEAKRFSDHPSSAEGGRLGILDRRQLAAFGGPFLRAIDSLQPGETSGLVQHRRDLWVVQVHESWPARALPLAEAMEAARRHLGRERVELLRSSIEAELVDTFDIEVSSD